MDVWNMVNSVAAVGALLLAGLSYYKTLTTDRVRLQVECKYFFGVGGFQGREGISIEVINRSAFPVTIREFGFRKLNGERMLLLQPLFANGERMPIRLEPRRQTTAYHVIDTEAQWQELDAAPYGYVKTECNTVADALRARRR